MLVLHDPEGQSDEATTLSIVYLWQWEDSELLYAFSNDHIGGGRPILFP